MVFLLSPGLGRHIESIQREAGLAFEHGHQSTLNATPEGLLFGVLVRRIRQRRLMHDTQGGQAVGGFLSQHGRAVVGHQRTWQTAFHKSLTQGMDQALRRLIQIPL